MVLNNRINLGKAFPKPEFPYLENKKTEAIIIYYKLNSIS